MGIERPFCGLVLGVVLSLGGCSDSSDREGKRPHVVIVLADDLGWGDVGFLGSELETPHLDRLAENGMVLERFYSDPYCTPSRAALLTGRSPMRYGLSASVLRPWGTSGLPGEEFLLSEFFFEAGYETALVGKWHLGHGDPEMLPNAQGFEHFYGHLNGRIDYFTHQLSYRTLGNQDLGLDWQRDGVSVREEGYSTDLIAAEAVERVVGRDRDRPLFLVVSFNAPHPPMQALPEDLEASSASCSSRGGEVQRRVFGAMVSALDRGVGEVRDALEREGILDETLLLFASDNGAAPARGGRNLPFRGGKASTWEGGVRVPAFVHWPRRIEPGSRCVQRVSLLDVFPTLAEAVGIPLESPRPLDGKSVWGSLLRGEVHPREDFYFAALNGDLLSFAISGERWKLVRHIDRTTGARRDSLHDLVEDPGEEKDFAASHPDRVLEMTASLERWLTSGGAVISPDAESPPAGWMPPLDWAAATR